MFPTWLRRSSFLMLSMFAVVALWPLIVYAQEAAAQSEPQNIAALAFRAATTLLALAITGAVLALGKMLLAKAQGTSFEVAANRLWNLFLTNAHQAWREKLQPKWAAITADGKITAEEWTDLKATLIDLVREQIGPSIFTELRKLGVLGSPDSFLSSMADKALLAMAEKQGVKLPPVLPSSKPTPPPPSEPAVPDPAITQP